MKVISAVIALSFETRREVAQRMVLADSVGHLVDFGAGTGT